MVELGTGDVQVAVRAVRLQSFEAEYTVFRARDRVGDFGSAGFDHAAVRRDDQHRRMRSSARPDAILAALHLVAREFRVRRVFIQTPLMDHGIPSRASPSYDTPKRKAPETTACRNSRAARGTADHRARYGPARDPPFVVRSSGRNTARAARLGRNNPCNGTGRRAHPDAAWCRTYRRPIPATRE